MVEAVEVSDRAQTPLVLALRAPGRRHVLLKFHHCQASRSFELPLIKVNWVRQSITVPDPSTCLRDRSSEPLSH